MPVKLNDGDILNINTDNHRGDGKHHVGMKNCNGVTMYFDSFAVAPLPEALKLAKTRDNEIIYNSYRLQDFDSFHCGRFCIDFLENVNDYKSYHIWLLNYSPWNFKENDLIVMKRLGLK